MGNYSTKGNNDKKLSMPSRIIFRFRSNLPVVSNLTAMNLWDSVCMTMIYLSFIEFVIVNYLARWVQDPDTKKRKKENPILQVLNYILQLLQ